MTPSSRTIVIYGGGFAAHLTAAAFERGLGKAARVILLAPDETTASDVMYGNVSAPSAFNFFTSVGLDEPTLMQRTRSAFSFGTRFENWPSRSSTWMQTFHLPLPLLSGVPFQQYLSAEGRALEPYLISAQAALKGVFAHPPGDPRHPLSRAEYGYQFRVEELRDLLAERNATRDIEFINQDLREIQVADGRISGLILEGGQQIEADLFVDCSSEHRRLISALGVRFQAGRKLRAKVTQEPSGQLGPAFRSLKATENGWTARTPLQGGVSILTVTHPDTAHDAADLDFQTGRLQQAWVGNCVAIGHAAWGVEPLTPAPMLLLQRDIERALDLIPVTANCEMEAREYNRRFDDDFVHATAFQRALFVGDEMPNSPYWKAAAAEPVGDKLERKLAQFKSRGLFVRFDLEPFNEEDWAILLNGMGIKPERYDRQVDGVKKTAVAQQLQGMARAVAQMVSKMPPHHVYMTNMKRYLEKQKHG